MSNDTFRAIKEGMDDALAYAKGNKKAGKAHRVHVPDVDVSGVREQLHMTQEEFAHGFDARKKASMDTAKALK